MVQTADPGRRHKPNRVSGRSPEFADAVVTLKSRNMPGLVVLLHLNRFFRTFGAPSKPLRSANPLSIRE
jgi:hypothetical protein